MFAKNRNIISNLGFSLLEMGVVLAAVSAITVVALGGKAVVDKSRLGGIITDIKGFSDAEDAFEKQYNGIAGDITAIASLTRTKSGNGNGVIDSADESLQFWQDLALSGLIKGAYDGTSTNIPGAGVPAGPYKSSGYNILNTTSVGFPSQSIVVELAGFTSSSNAQPILTPENAKAIDAKLDDGNPGTGAVRGSTDSGCIVDGAYNVSNKTISCRIRFVLRQSGQASDPIDLDGACAASGATRRSPVETDVCPTGYIGKILQTCQFDDSGTNGTWVSPTQKTSCEPVKCYGGAQYNDQRTIPCAANFKGTGIKQTCSAEGVWVNNSTSCDIDTTILCTDPGNIRQSQACNWGQTGIMQQSCVAGRWRVTNDGCAKITCSGSVLVGGSTITPMAGQFVGTVITNPSAQNTCGTNYVGTTNIMCTIDGSWQVTSSRCVPTYGACTSGNSADTDFGCPPDQVGQNLMTCKNNLWTSKLDTCKPKTASGERIGTARVIPDAKCPNDASGVMVEVAKADNTSPSGGSWVANTKHCALACPSSASVGGDNAGNAIWPNAIAGDNNVSGTCIAGYTGTPTRNCSADNTWSAVTGACTQITCVASEITLSYATWLETKSLTDNVQGQCAWPDYEGLPLANCDATGTWNLISPCNAALLPIRSGLKLWLDANDTTTLYSGSDCATGGNPAHRDLIGCWKDKSGNAKNATQATSTNKPAYLINIQNGHPALSFDGSTNYMSLPDNIIVNGDMRYTVFITAIENSLGKSGLLNLASYDVNDKSLAFRYDSGAFVLNYWFNRDISTAAGSVVAALPYVFTFTYDGSGRAIYVNGTQSATDNASGRNGLNNGNGTVGKTYGSEYLNGNIYEINVYDQALGSSDIGLVNDYLKSKWGI
jgi:hypothetical protein